MKKLLSIVLLIAMLCTSVVALTACPKPGPSDSDINMDIDLSNKPNLKVLLPNSGKDENYLNTNSNALLVQELTGYVVDYDQLPADASSTLNTTFMNKTPYNLIELTKDQFSDLVKDDALVDITDALAKFAPDILANISEESWDVVTVDGRIYGIPERASSDNIENPIVFNYDLMLKLNLDMPETLEEFEDVLAAMTNYLGKPALTFNKFTPLVHAISAAFGIHSFWQEYDGEVLFYMNAPRYNEYVEYMHSLYEKGYIDVEVSTNDDAACVNRFVNGFKANATGAKAGAYACSLWTVSSIVTSLQSNSIISKEDAAGDLTNYLGYLRALKENADDEEKVYRSSGYTYITAIPYYMAENAGYALDWMNSKIKDTATEDNFRQIVIGEEGKHWEKTSDGGYMPINPAFAEKDDAHIYLNGTNENKYTQYWLARVRKQPELFRAWSELMEDADEVGVYNIADFTPPLADYNTYRSSVEEYAQTQFYVMLKDGAGILDSVLSQLNGNKGCDKATADINNWYKNVYTK